METKKNENLENEIQEESEELTTEETYEIDPLVLENTKLNEELSSFKDKYLRELAEVENYKKRVNEERLKERKYASSEILKKLITVVDNFERSLLVESYESVDELKKGVQLIKEQFDGILKQEGLEVIEALDKEFDPNFHQAISTESVDEKDNNIVIEEFQKGYMYKDRVLRPSMVKVNQK